MKVVEVPFGVDAKPRIEMRVARVSADVWDVLGFKKYHYMTEDINSGGCKCLLFCWQDFPVAFVALAPQLSKGVPRGSMRFSRIVVLPDYQGLGFASRIMEFCGGLVKSKSDNANLYIKTIHLGVGCYLQRSSKWEATLYNGKSREGIEQITKSAKSRKSFCFKYIGAPIYGYEGLLDSKSSLIEEKVGQMFFDL